MNYGVMKKSSGYVFPTILLATLAIGFFTITLAMLQSSHKDQLMHLNSYQRALNIATSVCVTQLAELKEKQWEYRFFKDKPVIKANQELFNGKYDYCIEDYNLASKTFNIKVRVNIAGKKSLFYWRYQYITNMLDFSRLVIPIFFDQFPEELFDNTKKGILDGKVDSQLIKREQNKAKAQKISKIIRKEKTPAEILKKLGAIPAKGVAGLKDKDSARSDKDKIDLVKSSTPKTDITKAVSELNDLISNVDELKLPAIGSNIDESFPIRLRESPWGTYIAKIPPSASNIKVLSIQGDWFEVIYNGVSGYAHINFIAVPGYVPSGIEPPYPPGVDMVLE